MTQLTPAQVKSAVLAFLTAQYEKKTESERKQLEKAKAAEELEKISEISAKIAEIQQKYCFDDWIEDAATRMAKQLKFGTHISKGVYPGAKGDNVNFQTNRTLPAGLIGSQTIASQLLDANGSAAALPLAAFFDIELEDSGTKLRTLIMQDSPVLNGVFAEDEVRSAEYQALFKNALGSELSKPTTHERNKQLLFPIDQEQYHCIVPLYPSVFTHELYQRVIQLRFSEANKLARENRFKKSAEQKEYLSIPNTAVTILGGKKPQNVSQLMSKQGGRNYLLPSLPPHFKQQYQFSIGQNTSTIFSKNLTYLCREPLQRLFKIVRTDYNNVHIRKARKDSLDDILLCLISAAGDTQSNRPAGWSKETNLNYDEKLWLDPNRTLLDDEETFKTAREKGEWRANVTKRFADWLNAVLKKEFKQLKHDFADPEHREWQRELEEMIKESLRIGQEVFI